MAAAENFNKKFDGLENESSDDYSEKDLRILDNSKTDSGNGSNEKIEYEKPGGEKNRILSKNRFKSMNNLTHGNQYQIGNIFIFNRLSEKKENAVSNFNEYEKGDGEVFSQLTTGKTGDFLGETLNNLKYSAVSKATEDDRSGVTNLPSVESEIDLTKDFRCNFSKAYLHRNLTSERISQMSKIIDFVERYHGIMSNLKSSVDLSPRGDAENVSHVSLIKNQIENAKTKKSERKGTHGRRKVELTWATPRILSEGPKVVAEDSYHSKTETFRRKGSFT